MSRSAASLVFFLLLCLGGGLIDGFAFSTSVGEWYPTLVKPNWQPPPWLFAPVWSILYVLMAIAAWLIWRKDTRFSGTRVALVFFFAQLALNFAWTPVFFGAHAIGAALIVLCVLWLVLLLTTWAFFAQSRLAGALMLPYLAWTSFAATLNFMIWRLN